MRAAQAVAVMSNFLGIAQDEANRIDRSIAEAGLRQRGKGRAVPDMTIEERLRFLVACMGVEHPTKANVEAPIWWAARGLVNQRPPRPTARELEEAWCETVEEYEAESDALKHVDRLDPFLKPVRLDTGEVQLIDYLMVIAPLFLDGTLRPDRFNFSIEPGAGIAVAEYLGKTGDVIFADSFVPTTIAPGKRPSLMTTRTRSTRMRRISIIGGEALERILRPEMKDD